METVAPQGGSNSKGEAAAGVWGSSACRNSNPPHTACRQDIPGNMPWALRTALSLFWELCLCCHLNLGEAEQEGTGWHTHTPKGWDSSFPILGIICTAPKRKIPNVKTKEDPTLLWDSIFCQVPPEDKSS